MHLSLFTHRKNNAKNDVYSFSNAAGAIKPDADDWFEDNVLYIFGTFHLIFSLWMLVEYFVVNKPNFVLPRLFYLIPWVSTSLKFNIIKLLSDVHIEIHILSSMQITLWSQGSWWDLLRYQHIWTANHLCGGKPSTLIWYYDTLLCILKYTPSPQVFVGCSIASLPLYGYFYPFCLLHIIINNDILQRVLRSVTKNGQWRPGSLDNWL